MMDFSLFSHVITQALQRAASAASEMIGCPIEMSTPTVELMPPECLPSLSTTPEAPMVVTYVAFEGDFAGHAFVMFDTQSACKIISSVLGPGDVDPELGSSLIAEIGNVTCSSVVNTIADYAGARITPTPPDMASDMNGAVLECLATSLTGLLDEVLVIRTQFAVFEEKNQGYLFYMPEKSCMERLVSTAGGT